VVEQQSELASDIENENLGVVCKGLSKEALVESYQELAAWLDDNKNSSDRIKRYAKHSGSPDAAAEKWKQLIDEIA
jgi:predicted TPR repeat methyltransferase